MVVVKSPNPSFPENSFLLDLFFSFQNPSLDPFRPTFHMYNSVYSSGIPEYTFLTAVFQIFSLSTWPYLMLPFATPPWFFIILNIPLSQDSPPQDVSNNKEFFETDTRGGVAFGIFSS